jgi:hypothetical protein
MLDIALEVPLRALAVGGLGQRDDTGHARIEVLHEALDGAALAGGVAALKQHHHLLAGVLDPALGLEQFDLKFGLLLFIGGAAHSVL